MKPWRSWILLISLTCLSIGIYLGSAARTYRQGYPLDDAWIHQVYARNLASGAGWGFFPGQPDGGSTAPLWSGLISLGYWLGIQPMIWTFTLGGASLLGLVLIGRSGINHNTSDSKKIFFFSLLIVFEWHMVWAAGSGMETLLYSCLVTLVIVWLAGEWGRWFLLGFAIGAAVWLRPDGITLLGPALVSLWLPSAGLDQKAKKSAQLASGFSIPFGLYLMFHFSLIGKFWPTTLIAKQAEYELLQTIPFPERVAQLALQPLIGAGIFLLPAAIVFGLRAVRSANWPQVSGILWAVGTVCLYAWRLPVTYQHGRYLIPIVPIFFIWGVSGLPFSQLGKARTRFVRWATLVWICSIAGISIAFYIQGGRAYGLDVAVIESEMVDTANWLAQNTPERALIAAHDIGALGYFSNRRLVDLGGLVSPQVIPFLRQEELLAGYLELQQADYLVTLGGWYPRLEISFQLVHSSGGIFSPLLGGTNMLVYRIRE